MHRCDLHCPNSFLVVLGSVVEAVWKDVLTVVRLIASCFGTGGISNCVCSLALTLQPTWRKVSTSPIVRCENGDAFMILVSRIDDLIQRGVESVVNFLIDRLNDIINSITGWFGAKNLIRRVCWPTAYDADRCVGGEITIAQRLALEQCEDAARGLEEMCYYARVSTHILTTPPWHASSPDILFALQRVVPCLQARHICTDNGLLSEYQELFARGYKTVDETEAEFARVFGASFTQTDPLAADLMRAVEQSLRSGPDLAPRRDICSSRAFETAMSLEMAIVSCFFATAESFCEEGAEEDEDFAFVIQTSELQLPRVPWHLLVNRDVSPPPPPPLTLPAYQALINEDSAGFQMVHAELEKLFPLLEDAATSSVGASIGPHIAPFVMTPQQLTRATLASHGMTKNSLGARVIQSKHTGLWRPACFELKRFLDNADNAGFGTLSKAHEAGVAGGDASYSGKHDRNLFMYAMLEIFISLDHANHQHLSYSSLGVHEMVCGRMSSGYRVPVPEYQWTTYDTGGLDVHTFAPVVAHGSLESLRSSLASQAHACPEGFAPEDLAQSMYCGGIGGVPAKTQLANDAFDRVTTSPFALLRDRMCNPAVEYSVEDALARPPSFSAPLFDTQYRSKLYLNNLVVPASYRGEEDLDPAFARLSLQAWVYITSSADERVSPGFHRLLDLPSFASVHCNQLPNVMCSADAARINTETAVMTQFDAGVASYETGRFAITRHRCNANVETSVNRFCERAPYFFFSSSGCFVGDLDLVERPQLYSTEHWFSVLNLPSPSPPPSPQPPPPPQTPPPSPQLPPAPPYVEAHASLLARVRGMEEQACTSVYYLSTASRCNRLAAHLSESIYYQADNPPSPPPALPTTSPPPSPRPPPSPVMPAGIVSAPTPSSLLSTIRFPAVQSRRRLDALLQDGYYVAAADEAALRAAAASLPANQKARCTPTQSAAPLACATPDFNDECIDGELPCASTVTTTSPTLDISLSSPPRKRGARLWGLRFSLPAARELADLFVRSAEASGGTGAAVDVFDSNGAPLPCKRDVGVGSVAPENRAITHVCMDAVESSADAAALGEAARVRVTLPGEFRTIFVGSVDILEISN